VALVTAGSSAVDLRGAGSVRIREEGIEAIMASVPSSDAHAPPTLIEQDGRVYLADRVSPVAVLLAGPLGDLDAEAKDRVTDGLQMLREVYADLIEQATRAHRAQSQMMVLNTVGEIISREPDIDQVVKDILHMATSLMEADNGSVMLVSPGTDVMRIAYAQGLPPEVVDQVRVKVGEGVSGHVAKTGEPVLMRKGQRHRLSTMTQQRWSAAICVPLRIRDRVVGVLNIRDDTRGTDFTEDDVHLALTFASQAALAIENKRLVEKLTERVADAQSEVLEINQDLTQIRERLQNIVRSIANPVLVADAERTLMLINRSAEEALGLQPGLALMRPIVPALSSTEEGEVLAEALQRVFAGETTETPEIALGSPVARNYQVHVSPIYSGGETVDGYVISMLDVTELRELAALKSEVVSLTSHELKTPLTAIVGFARTLKDKSDAVDDETRAEFLGIILNQAARVNNLVTNLLDLSKIEAGRALDLNVRETSVPDMLLSAVTAVREAYASDTHEFRVEVADGLSSAHMDADKIEQVVINFLTNAVKYSDPGEVVVSACHRADGGLRLSVTDHGKGISEEELPTVFDRFQRVGDKSHRRKAGHGLGLYLCKAFVEAHGGDIGVTSKTGEGSTFYLDLPAHTANPTDPSS
jgi:two-component system phosphate regulon sensor histidine kinase PhoR